MAGTLLSVNVGLPKDVSWRGQTVFTGVFNEPVAGPRQVGRLNVDVPSDFALPAMPERM